MAALRQPQQRRRQACSSSSSSSREVSKINVDKALESLRLPRGVCFDMLSQDLKETLRSRVMSRCGKGLQAVRCPLCCTSHSLVLRYFNNRRSPGQLQPRFRCSNPRTCTLHPIRSSQRRPRPPPAAAAPTDHAHPYNRSSTTSKTSQSRQPCSRAFVEFYFKPGGGPPILTRKTRDLFTPASSTSSTSSSSSSSSLSLLLSAGPATAAASSSRCRISHAATSRMTVIGPCPPQHASHQLIPTCSRTVRATGRHLLRLDLDDSSSSEEETEAAAAHAACKRASLSSSSLPSSCDDDEADNRTKAMAEGSNMGTESRRKRKSTRYGPPLSFTDRKRRCNRRRREQYHDYRCSSSWSCGNASVFGSPDNSTRGHEHGESGFKGSADDDDYVAQLLVDSSMSWDGFADLLRTFDDESLEVEGGRKAAGGGRKLCGWMRPGDHEADGHDFLCLPIGHPSIVSALGPTQLVLSL